MKIEIREDRATLEGYVTAVARDSRILASPQGPFVEQVAPKTFERALGRGKTVELRFNHGKLLGSTADGTLELREDAIGLKAKAEISDPELIDKARRGELRGWSFGFHKLKDRWEEWRDGIQRRYLEDIDLLEVSLLDKTPAYIGTSVEERDGEHHILEERSVQDEAEVTEDAPPAEEKKDNTMADYRRRRLKIGGTK